MYISLELRREVQAKKIYLTVIAEAMHWMMMARKQIKLQNRRSRRERTTAFQEK